MESVCMGTSGFGGALVRPVVIQVMKTIPPTESCWRGLP